MAARVCWMILKKIGFDFSRINTALIYPKTTGRCTVAGLFPVVG
jgi:hypothetical protein